MSRSRLTPWKFQLLLTAIMVVLWLAITLVSVHVASVAPLRPGVEARRAYWMAAYVAPLSYLLLLALYAWLSRRLRATPD